MDSDSLARMLWNFHMFRSARVPGSVTCTRGPASSDSCTVIVPVEGMGSVGDFGVGQGSSIRGLYQSDMFSESSVSPLPGVVGEYD